MPIAIIELLAKVGLYFLEWFMRKSATDAQAKQDYIQFIEIMNRKKITSPAMVDEAEQQKKAADDLWKNQT